MEVRGDDIVLNEHNAAQIRSDWWQLQVFSMAWYNTWMDPCLVLCTCNEQAAQVLETVSWAASPRIPARKAKQPRPGNQTVYVHNEKRQVCAYRTAKAVLPEAPLSPRHSCGCCHPCRWALCCRATLLSAWAGPQCATCAGCRSPCAEHARVI